MEAPTMVIGWLGGKVIVGVVGAVFGLFAREILPTPIRDFIVYYGSHLRKWVKNDSYKLRIASKYELSSRRQEEELLEGIARRLGERPNDNGLFKFTRDGEDAKIGVEITPHYDKEITRHGDIQSNSDLIDSITLKVDGSPRYRRLTPSLLELQDIERNVIENIVAEGAERSGSNIKCEMPAKPTLQRLFGQGDIETIRAKSESGTKIDVTNDEMQIHATPNTTIISTVRNAIVHYA